MNERSWIIGSRADCDIQIGEPTVSGRHCRLTRAGDGFMLEDLGSSNGTFVAGERIVAPRQIRRGDPVTLGRNTPMPWPATASITIGRLPDNDLVIPLEVVSGHHARLERDGERMFIVDLNSSNGTAVGSPLNKVRRAAIEPGDTVYFGTHSVRAADLLAALPADGPRATALESASPLALARSAVNPRAGAPDAAGRPAATAAWHSTRSWAWGIALSAALVVLFVGAYWVFGGRSPQSSLPTTEVVAEHRPKVVQPSPSVVPSAPNVEQPFDKQAIRQSEDGVFLISARTGRLLVFTRSTAWAIGRDRIVCPTKILDQIENSLIKGDKLDDCIVVASPIQTLRVLKHQAVDGSPQVSVGRLDSPVDVVCNVVARTNGFKPTPKQKLAMLVAQAAGDKGQVDEPKSISRRLVELTIDQISRDSSGEPTEIICVPADDPGPAAGAPVFDGMGRVVACVERAKKDEVRAIPIARLIQSSQIDP